jgi:DHA3 family macrolide efflux protein-like MFS transporter
MKSFINVMKELRSFFILWSTQSLSSLGSSMTSFALIIWSYQQQGSALTTALLSVSSYVPYVVMSIFAGALSDQWNKKAVMLTSDSFAALCTVAVLFLLQSGSLEIWHLYVLNACTGLMNTIQQPAADVTISLLAPQKHYQKVSGMRSFSNSLVNILTPVLATAILSFSGIQAVIWVDLLTFGAAFFSLLFFIRIPPVKAQEEAGESVFRSARAGLHYLKDNRGILHMILFLAAINLTASVYNAAFPAMLLSRPEGGQTALGAVNAVSGMALLAGSVLATLLPAPKSRVRVVCNTLLFSMSTENFFLALGRSAPLWCLGAVLGWVCIPIMNANMDVLLRNRIPLAMQGRVFSARNTLQFFTIPIGYFLGGLLVDRVFEPLMAAMPQGSLVVEVFGTGKGSGAALLFFFLALAGIATCLIFRRDRHIWELEKPRDIPPS